MTDENKKNEEFENEITAEQEKEGMPITSETKPEKELETETVLASSSEIEKDHKSWWESFKEWLKNLLDKLKIYPQFSVFAKQIQQTQELLEEQIFNQNVTIEQLDKMREELKLCEQYIKDSGAETMRIKSDLCDFVTEKTTMTTLIDAENDKRYVVLMNPDAHFILDKDDDEVFENQPDTAQYLVKQNVRIYEVSETDGFLEFTKNITTLDDIKTIRELLEKGDTVDLEYSQVFESFDLKNKLHEADKAVSELCDISIDRVMAYQKHLEELLLNYSYEKTDKNEKTDKKEPEKPTDKQIKYAGYLSRSTGEPLPNEYTKTAYSEFISKCEKNIEKDEHEFER